MACEILIHRNVGNYSHPDSEKDKRGVYKKGYLITAKDTPCVWGNKEKFEAGKFVIIRVTNASASEINSYLTEWELEVDHEHVASNLSVDGHRYRLFATNPGTSFRGAITREKAENYLDQWNVTIHSVAQNEIVMDIVILDTIKSRGFWGELDGLGGMTAIELSYDQETGEHQIQFDWTYFRPEVVDPIKRQMVGVRLQRQIEKRGGEIVSMDFNNYVGVFNMSRTDVLKWFKSDIYEQVRKNNVLYRRQYYITESQVDQLVQYSTNNNGEPYELTKSQLASQVQSFLDKVDA